jgi:hypothetical protein
MTKRSRVLGFGSAALLVLAGIVGAVAVSGTVGQVLALTLIGFGFVLATGLVFLEVGLSEDRERAREAGRQAAADRRAQTREPPPRLGRLRGSRRRLR